MGAGLWVQRSYARVTPLTSIPRGMGVPNMDGTAARTATAAIGLATIGIGMYDATIELEGFIYAIPSQSCSCSK